MTPAQAAAYLTISTKTLDRHVGAGAIRYIVKGLGKRRTRAFDQADLDAIQRRPTAGSGGRMSIYKPKGREEYIYDFWQKGTRFHGAAGTEKREALNIEERAKAEAKTRASSTNDSTQLTLDIAIDRFWTEHGQYQKAAKVPWSDFERLIDKLENRPLNFRQFLMPLAESAQHAQVERRYQQARGNTRTGVLAT